MTNEEAGFEVLAYRRNVGATLDKVWRNIAYRTGDEHPKARAMEILRRLESDGELTSVGDRWFLTPAGRKRARGSAIEATWADADAWILLAAVYTCRLESKDLDELLGAADYINHAIPTQEELHGALNRLISGRLLKTRRSQILVTDRAVALYEKAETAGGRRVHCQLDCLGRLLVCPCCGVRLRSVSWRYPLDARTYAEVLAAYRERRS